MGKERVTANTEFPMRTSHLYWHTPFQGKAGKDGIIPPPVYKVTLLVPKSTPEGQATYSQIMGHLQKVAVDSGLPMAAALPPYSPMTSVESAVAAKVKCGDTAVDGEGVMLKVNSPDFAGHWLFSFTNKVSSPEKARAPIIVVGPSQEPITSPSVFQSGDYARIKYVITDYKHSGKRGVSLFFDGLQFCREGIRFGSSPSLAQVANSFGVYTPPVQAPAAGWQPPQGAMPF